MQALFLDSSLMCWIRHTGVVVGLPRHTYPGSPVSQIFNETLEVKNLGRWLCVVFLEETEKVR
jgi:hypothetical protein